MEATVQVGSPLQELNIVHSIFQFVYVSFIPHVIYYMFSLLSFLLPSQPHSVPAKHTEITDDDKHIGEKALPLLFSSFSGSKHLEESEENSKRMRSSGQQVGDICLTL